MKYITEYQPNLTKTCMTYIENNITPSLRGEESNIYTLDYVLEELSQEIDKNKNEEIFGISIADIKELNKLLNEQVDYIEF
jgi:hypothetical protein